MSNARPSVPNSDNGVVNNITNNTIVFAGSGNNNITYERLQEGDIFDKDIQRIMAIINGVEQEFNERKVSKNFQNALDNAVHRRQYKVHHDNMLNYSLNSKSYTKKQPVMPNTYATFYPTTGQSKEHLTDADFTNVDRKRWGSREFPVSPNSNITGSHLGVSKTRLATTIVPESNNDIEFS